MRGPGEGLDKREQFAIASPLSGKYLKVLAKQTKTRNEVVISGSSRTYISRLTRCFVTSWFWWKKQLSDAFPWCLVPSMNLSLLFFRFPKFTRSWPLRKSGNTNLQEQSRALSMQSCVQKPGERYSDYVKLTVKLNFIKVDEDVAYTRKSCTNGITTLFHLASTCAFIWPSLTQARAFQLVA